MLLKGVGVPTNATAEGELFARERMLDVQRTFVTLELNGAWSGGTARQLSLGDIRNSLEIVVAGIAEMSGAETEEDGDGAAISAFVLQKVRSVFGAHLSS